MNGNPDGAAKVPLSYLPHLIYGLTIVFGGGSMLNEQLNHGNRIAKAEATIEVREHRIATLEADALVFKAQQEEQDRRIENLEANLRAHQANDEYWKARR
jgi:hypothetical protein